MGYSISMVKVRRKGKQISHISSIRFSLICTALLTLVLVTEQLQLILAMTSTLWAGMTPPPRGLILFITNLSNPLVDREFTRHRQNQSGESKGY